MKPIGIVVMPAMLGLLPLEYIVFDLTLLSLRNVTGDLGSIAILPKPFCVVIIMLVLLSKDY